MASWFGAGSVNHEFGWRSGAPKAATLGRGSLAGPRRLYIPLASAARSRVTATAGARRDVGNAAMHGVTTDDPISEDERCTA